MVGFSINDICINQLWVGTKLILINIIIGIIIEDILCCEEELINIRIIIIDVMDWIKK